MKISATFSTGDLADKTVREIKSAGIGIFSRQTIPLDHFTPTPSRIEERMYYPSGMDILGSGTLQYVFPQEAPPMGVWGDEPLNPDRGGRTRLELTVEDSARSHVHSIFVANNASDIHFHP